MAAQISNKGYWLSSFSEPGKIIDLPVPKASSGSVVVEVLATLVLPYLTQIHQGGVQQANLMLPLVPNANCIGRIIEVGPDATLVKLEEKLGNPERLKYAVMTGDVDADAAAILRLTPDGKGADVFNDWTPGWIEKPVFLQAGLKALKVWGKVVLSGAAWGSADIPYAESIHNNWQVIARWCCTRATLTRVLDLINQGQLKVGKSTGGEFTTFEQVEEVERAKEHASKNGRFKQYTVLLPNGPIETIRLRRQ